MEQEKRYICGSDEIYFFKGFISLHVKDLDIPDTLTVRGVELMKRTSLHVSLVCVKGIVERYGDNISDVEEKVIQLFCEYLKTNSITFGEYGDEFRFAESEERKTLVVMCTLDGLNSFFDLLKQKLDIEMSKPPPHVTLYTLQLNAGIGLISDQKVQDLSVDVTQELDLEFVSKIK